MRGLKSHLKTLWNVAHVRFLLLVRQKLGWISFLVGIGLVMLSLITAQVSFVNPQKIFWDFGHSVLFILQAVLSIYLGSQLFSDEKNRRTMHLVLSGGISRTIWFCGNILGIWLAIVSMLAFWVGLVAATSQVVFQKFPLVMSLQAVGLMCLESAIVLLLGFFISLFVRPLLALLATGVLVFLLHSLTSLQLIFADKQVGAFVDTGVAGTVLFLSRFFPPLEWLDLKIFIGFQDSISWQQYLLLMVSGSIWVFILAVFGKFRFERMDL
jgi:ABC-type transport system involved in multi-copper enzyme maturation permease subunit